MANTLQDTDLINIWHISESSYDFGQNCYRKGMADGIKQTQARKADPVLNGVCHVIEHFSTNYKKDENY